MSRACNRLFVVVIALFSFGTPLRAQTKLDWNPEETHVFVAGLLEWKRSDLYGSFPAAMKDRRDEQLVEHFRKAGVPDEQITYLQDAEATKARVKQELVELLDETDEGDLLVLYFCGHGYRDKKSGRTWFATYDAGDTNESGWSVKDIFDAIENRFSGNRALLMADCCHSGALFDLAQQRRDSKIAYAVLTSSYSHNSSTGNWTFSDSVLTGLRGNPLVDADGNKQVDLQEIANYTAWEMAFIEGQKSMFVGGKGFPGKTNVATVEKTVKPRVGQRIEVSWQGKWYKAKIIDVSGQQAKIHYTNYDNAWDEWVGPDRIRKYAPAQFAEGDKVQVQWATDKKWYPATVVKGWYGLHQIHYDGYDATHDEWIGPGAIKRRTN